MLSGDEELGEDQRELIKIIVLLQREEWRNKAETVNLGK